MLQVQSPIFIFFNIIISPNEKYKIIFSLNIKLNKEKLPNPSSKFNQKSPIFLFFNNFSENEIKRKIQDYMELNIKLNNEIRETINYCSNDRLDRSFVANDKK